MSQTLYYSSTAVSMTLSAGIGSGDTTCTLSSTTGLPASFPFKLLIDYGAGTQEVVYCTGLSGSTATIQRGKDGSTAQSHAINATVVHGVSAEEYNNADIHRNSTSGVHGVTGSVVGTSDAQTLTNKTLTSPTVTAPTITGAINGGASFDTHGHIQGGGGSPSVTMEPSAGTSPPAAVLTACTDQAGQITFGTGTAPAAGFILRITFSQAYATTPKIVLTPMSSATAALNLFVVGVNTTTADIGVVNAPSASQPNTAYGFHYAVIG